MLPEVDIIYSHEYAKRLHQGNAEPFADVWQKVIRIGADFEQIFEAGQQLILELIEQYSGFAWEEYSGKSIPIYLSDEPSSFPQPLTLAVNDDGATMLEDCIYQLTYRNMSFGFLDDKQRDDCIQSVTDHVLAELAGDEEVESTLDLHKMTIKKLLKK